MKPPPWMSITSRTVSKVGPEWPDTGVKRLTHGTWSFFPFRQVYVSRYFDIIYVFVYHLQVWRNHHIAD